jgi:hypothetical protein
VDSSSSFSITLLRKKAPLELFKTIGKTPESSVPVLSAAKPWFSQGFSHFWPIALEFCSAHAGSVHGVVRRLYFASRTPNRVVFRVARVAKSLGIAFADLFILVECVGGRNRLTSSAIFDR